ncbi:uncharacterized protein MYCFIDRAFT_78928 [Pseudocercospora fijiensis CIRAD86]|uniref:Uncharacterized protein n=1 Tax=Pseudocercospora fijiensis (strain CIRAD86) TaxID=383855 RepID=M3AAI7_PSEFD|nr:uncharacterized protein MYCFIDRAFT_78928 [Pseudocercospora fijiensis CIRAD86]EME81611.1 hypothetical protein MYCFIDRAFT_78928 [Pseudocercospora fijiensis CIRAD86]
MVRGGNRHILPVSFNEPPMCQNQQNRHCSCPEMPGLSRIQTTQDGFVQERMYLPSDTASTSEHAMLLNHDGPENYGSVNVEVVDSDSASDSQLSSLPGYSECARDLPPDYTLGLRRLLQEFFSKCAQNVRARHGIGMIEVAAFLRVRVAICRRFCTAGVVCQWPRLEKNEQKAVVCEKTRGCEAMGCYFIAPTRNRTCPSRDSCFYQGSHPPETTHVIRSMPPPRPPHDPFATTIPTASSLRHQPSQSSLRSHASAASTRHNGLLTSARTRRPNNRSTPRLEDGVLADSESDRDTIMAPRQKLLQQRGFRHGSPERRHARPKPARQQVEDQDIVNRQPDGSYLLGAPALGTPSLMPMYGSGHEDGEVNPARKYFTSGTHMGVRQSRQAEDEYERDRPEMMAVLRQEVMHKLDKERWLYEPGDGLPTILPAS